MTRRHYAASERILQGWDGKTIPERYNMIDAEIQPLVEAAERLCLAAQYNPNEDGRVEELMDAIGALERELTRVVGEEESDS